MPLTTTLGHLMPASPGSQHIVCITPLPQSTVGCRWYRLPWPGRVSESRAVFFFVATACHPRASAQARFFLHIYLSPFLSECVLLLLSCRGCGGADYVTCSKQVCSLFFVIFWENNKKGCADKTGSETRQQKGNEDTRRGRLEREGEGSGGKEHAAAHGAYHTHTHGTQPKRPKHAAKQASSHSTRECTSFYASAAV